MNLFYTRGHAGVKPFYCPEKLLSILTYWLLFLVLLGLTHLAEMRAISPIYFCKLIAPTVQYIDF